MKFPFKFLIPFFIFPLLVSCGSPQIKYRENITLCDVSDGRLYITNILYNNDDGSTTVNFTYQNKLEFIPTMIYTTKIKINRNETDKSIRDQVVSLGQSKTFPIKFSKKEIGDKIENIYIEKFSVYNANGADILIYKQFNLECNPIDESK